MYGHIGDTVHNTAPSSYYVKELSYRTVACMFMFLSVYLNSIILESNSISSFCCYYSLNVIPVTCGYLIMLLADLIDLCLLIVCLLLYCIFATVFFIYMNTLGAYINSLILKSLISSFVPTSYQSIWFPCLTSQHMHG